MSAPFTLEPQAAPLVDARALTLWQPWAWLIAHGHKNIENRPRGFSFKSFRGDFWIHAATESTKQIASFLAADKLCSKILGDTFRIPDATTLAYGAIIGRATITDIVLPHALEFEQFREASPWHFPEQYGFRIENARPLATPVPCRGYQGFWRVPPDVLEKLGREGL